MLTVGLLRPSINKNNFVFKHSILNPKNQSTYSSSSFRSFSSSLHLQWKKQYNPKELEREWQLKWKERELKKREDKNGRKDSLESYNYYALTMFPYPSGNLHMGHVRVYTISDTISKMKSMQGFKVFQPMGWDAFGLPAENAAIERGLNPEDWTKENISQMKRQLIALGTHFQWNHELATCDASYYKWTQYLFLKLLEKGLAYQQEAVVNWDPIDNTVLANEQVDAEGKSWRSGALVQKKLMKQWFFRIKQYSDALVDDLDKLKGWPDEVKVLQKNWIGRSDGVLVDFSISNSDKHLKIFTTRLDTLFGVSFLAVASDHPLLSSIVSDKQKKDIERFSNEMSQLDEAQRNQKKGIDTGSFAIHPLSGEKIPIWVADYVLSDYGTGAVMGVPAHDQRDFEFAQKHGFSWKTVVNSVDEKIEGRAFEGEGPLINSQSFDGLKGSEATERIFKTLEQKGVAAKLTNYRLRDWLVSRQRYWGAPIPLIHCSNCGVVSVPEKDLPVELPKNIKLSGKGSPLDQMAEWKRCKCPKCNGDAERETDTMDTFVDSSWYFMRFPHNLNDHQ
eukprot:TRINITY_DN7836_c0_g1_i3.p1 TRINITY_DN7836_c0_g1~~TRINITY_DN7836_c0_g1_i3.p1  ORF type:complete len:562 (+),score=149.65 TRINITY_DN7836_c0_g1_i3:93-1778(+)